MGTKMTFINRLIIAVVLLFLNVQYSYAQINAMPDLGYLVKNSTLDFYPTNNDILATPLTYKAKVDLASLHGKFSIDSLFPFKATYIPDNNYTGADTMYYKVCNSNNTICGITSITLYISNPTISNVWPGDFNNDGSVSALDILFLANSMNQMGKSGFNRSEVWGPYFCDAWNQTTFGVDLKYIDGNGDGIIDLNDVLIAQNNMNKFRTANIATIDYTPYTSSKNMPLSLKIRNKNLVKGDTMEVDVFFGDTTSLNTNQRYITGSAFKIGFDSIHAIAFNNAKAWFTTEGNWISKGSGVNSIQLASRKNDEMAFEVAMSRVNHIAKASNNNPGCNNMTLSITTKDKVTSGSVAEIYTSITGGNAPYNYVWSNGSTSANITGLNISYPSSHAVTVTDIAGCSVVASVTVLDRNNNDKGNLGTLKVIIDEDIFQLSGGTGLNIELKNAYFIDDQIPEFVNVIANSETWKSTSSSIATTNFVGSGYTVSNPYNKESVLIELKNPEEIIQSIQIIDINGRIMPLQINRNTHNALINLENLNTGYYIIQLNTDRDHYSIKMGK